MLDGKGILITGGTGSFGQKLTETIFRDYRPREVVIFSRDEFKQSEMAKRFRPDDLPVRYFLGDIRDKERLQRAFTNIDIVVHAAALKQVPALEANPFEAVKTNILGAQNIVEAALDRNVRQVVALSTDKAVNPINLYGATKLAMEKIIVAANAYVRHRDISFLGVRYGNVVGSRGSVIPFFLELIRRGVRELPVTDPRMTRFWITLEEGVALVLRAIAEGSGGEVFIPKIPSMKVVDLVEALPHECTTKVVGIRPGEKLHESLIGEDEARSTFDLGTHYVVYPQFGFQRKGGKSESGVRVPEGFEYRSDSNDQWLTVEGLRKMIASYTSSEP
ncbi:MAG: UDP-N-acetylglucosamine 4,6-dehydratase (inverting) [Verrucomicrobia bacterium]|nr:UDP-N-acetylglucosamine 4,6-dehydratase (inverting) [Verrucomicrobiota bacterium]